MLKVGITGGIGSGKTTVCKLFEELGIDVYYADSAAKNLMFKNAALKAAIKALLGKDSYHANGRPNRKYIASIVFQNKTKLEDLNKLVHPEVAKDTEKWLANHKDDIYTLKEAALLVESNSHKQLDKLIIVSAPIDLRIKRVMQRDKVTKEQVEARVAKQMPEEEKIKYADYIIYNLGDKNELRTQVLDLHNKLSTL